MKANVLVGRSVVVCMSAVLAIACSDEAAPTDGGGAPSQAGAGGAAAGAPVGGSTGGDQPQAGSGATTGGAPMGGSTSGGASAGMTSGGGGASMGGAGAGSGGMSGGGSGGAAGQGGAGGGGGSGGGGSTKPSLGCEKAASIALNQWVDGMVMTGGSSRQYAVRLPSNYDAKRAYPVIMLLHGCGGGTNNVPMEKATGSDAILVRGTGSASGTCWDTKANGPDVAFFDAMIQDVKTRFCADEKRVFAVGYSSGSWLANQLTCIRADVLRGAATVTGGESAGGGCGGPVARIFIHDRNDQTNVISGSEKARDRQLTQNMCNKSAAPMSVDPSPCELYQGCAAGYPVEWCETMGEAHNRQDSFAPQTFWNFFKAL